MGKVRPSDRPHLARENIMGMIARAGFRPPREPVFVFARRGYFGQELGTLGTQGRGRYDDAIVIVTPTRLVPFNGNCDPSAEAEGMATLTDGVWRFKPGMHHRNDPARRYPAFIQNAEFIVRRDDTADDQAKNYPKDRVHPKWGISLGHDGLWRGWFGVNLHKGGDYSTSSLACQTVPKDEWPEFFAELTELLRTYEQSAFDYYLTTRDA